MHADRAAATKAGILNGWRLFDTVKFSNGVWIARQSNDSAAEAAYQWARNKSGVAHVGSRDRCPLVVLSVHPDEQGWSFPQNFLVEPLNPGLFEPRGPGHTPPAPCGDDAGGLRGEKKEPAASTAESPVALVHSLCADAHNAGTFDPKVVKKRAVEQGVNPSTAATQIYRWKKKHTA